MTALLTITETGNTKEIDALANGTPVPKLDKFIFGAGPVQDDPHLATPFEFWHAAPVFSVEKLSQGALKLTCHLGPEVEGRIREIGLLMEDGTLYGYAPYQVEQDGFFKAEGFAFTYSAIISKENIGHLTITYAPLDVDALSAEIAGKATARISAESGGFQIATIRSFSAGNRVAFEQQKQINKLEARK